MDLSLLVRALNYRDQVTRQTNRTAVFLSSLPVRPAKSEYARLAVEYGGLTAATYSEGASFGTPASDIQTPAPAMLALLDVDFGISDLVKDVAAVNGVPGNADQFVRQLVSASATLAKKVNGDLFTGTGIGTTAEIIGLDTWIDDSNTVATIDRSSATYWQSYVAEGTATTLTKKLVYADLAEVSNLGGIKPNVAICNGLVLAQVQALFDGNIQYIKNLSEFVAQPLLGGGPPAIVINGCAFVEDSDGYTDSDADTGVIYYLNSDHIWIDSLSSQRIVAAGLSAQEATIPAMGGANSMDMLGLGFQYKLAAKTGHSTAANVSCQLQLCIDRPNMFGKRTNVSLSTS
jgi:hypothetical protein